MRVSPRVRPDAWVQIKLLDTIYSARLIQSAKYFRKSELQFTILHFLISKISKVLPSKLTHNLLPAASARGWNLTFIEISFTLSWDMALPAKPIYSN